MLETLMAGILVATCRTLRQQLFQARVDAEGAVAAKSELLDASNALKSEGASQSIRLEAELVSARDRLCEQSAKVSQSESAHLLELTSHHAEDETILELKHQLVSAEAAKIAAAEEARILGTYPDLQDGDPRISNDIADDVVRLQIGLSRLQRSAIVDSLSTVYRTEVAKSLQFAAENRIENSQELEAVETCDAIERERLQWFAENAQLRSQIVIEAASKAALEHQTQIYKLGASVQDAHHSLLQQYGASSHRIVGFEIIAAPDVNDLGMSFANLPPGHVFVQDIGMGGWAHSAGIRAGAAVIALNSEDVERMIPERFQALLHFRPLQIKIVPPVTQSAMDKAEVQLGMLVKSVARAKNDIESGRLVPLSFNLEGIDFSKLHKDAEALMVSCISQEIAKLAGVEEDAVDVKLGGSTPLVHAVAFTSDSRVADLMRGRLVVATTSTGTKPAPLQAAVSRVVKSAQGSSLATYGQIKISNTEVGLVTTPDGEISKQQQSDERLSNAMAAYHYQEYDKLLGELLVARAEALNAAQTALARGELALGPLKEVTAVATDKFLGFALDNSRPGPLVVKDVTGSGWAAKHGLTPGTVILAMNGEDSSSMSALKLSTTMKNRPLRLLTRTPLPLDLPDVSFDGQELSQCHEINLLRGEIAVAQQESIGNMKVQNAEDEAKFEYAEARRLENIVQFEMNLISDLRNRERETRKDAVYMSVLGGKAVHPDLAWTGEFGLVTDIQTTLKDLREEREAIKEFRRSLSREEKLAMRDTEAWEAHLARVKQRSRGHMKACGIAIQVGSDEVTARELMQDELEEEENLLSSERKASAVFRDEAARAQQSSWREGALADFLQNTLRSLNVELSEARNKLQEHELQARIVSTDVTSRGLSDAVEDALKLRREAEALHLEVCTWRSVHPSPVSVPPMEWRQDEKKLWQERDRLSPVPSPRLDSTSHNTQLSQLTGKDSIQALAQATRTNTPAHQGRHIPDLYSRDIPVRPVPRLTPQQRVAMLAQSESVPSTMLRGGAGRVVNTERPSGTKTWGRKSEEAVLRRVLGPGHDDDEYTGPLGDTGKHLEPPPPYVDLSAVRDMAHWAARNIEPSAPGQVDFGNSSPLPTQIPRLQALGPPLPPPHLS